MHRYSKIVWCMWQMDQICLLKLNVGLIHTVIAFGIK